MSPNHVRLTEQQALEIRTRWLNYQFRRSATLIEQLANEFHCGKRQIRNIIYRRGTFTNASAETYPAYAACPSEQHRARLSE